MRSRWGDSRSTSGCLQHSDTITGLNSRHVTTRLHQSVTPSLVSTGWGFLWGFFFFYGCMISKEDNLEKPVSQMRVLESTAFCCANFAVGGRCILFVASPVLMWVTLYDQPSLSWNLMICDRTKGQFVSDKKWLLCWISTYYAVKEKVTLWGEQLFSVCVRFVIEMQKHSHITGAFTISAIQLSFHECNAAV